MANISMTNIDPLQSVHTWQDNWTGQLNVNLKLVKLHPDAIIPTYATDGSACFDLYTIDGGEIRGSHDDSRELFRIGWAFEIPPGWVMKIYSRSGHGFKSSTRLSNCVGIIDSDYRDEVMVKLQGDWNSFLQVKPGDRIAQAMLEPVAKVHMRVVEKLSDSERKGGFGHSGA